MISDPMSSSPSLKSHPTILNDIQIIELCSGDRPMISPFSAESIRTKDGVKIPSRGLSSFGYDVSCQPIWKLAKSTGTVIDVLDDDDDSQWETIESESIIIPPYGYVMSSTNEHFCMPDNVSAIVLGKSTLARRGLIINATPIEAGFQGEVVIEIFNGNPNPVRIYSDHGIAQFLFIRGNTCSVSYSQRKGKYQNQTGVQLAKN